MDIFHFDVGCARINVVEPWNIASPEVDVCANVDLFVDFNNRQLETIRSQQGSVTGGE